MPDRPEFAYLIYQRMCMWRRKRLYDILLREGLVSSLIAIWWTEESVVSWFCSHYAFPPAGPHPDPVARDIIRFYREYCTGVVL